jgi:hypothetical protein
LYQYLVCLKNYNRTKCPIWGLNCKFKPLNDRKIFWPKWLFLGNGRREKQTGAKNKGTAFVIPNTMPKRPDFRLFLGSFEKYPKGVNPNRACLTAPIQTPPDKKSSFD